MKKMNLFVSMLLGVLSVLTGGGAMMAIAGGINVSGTADTSTGAFSTDVNPSAQGASGANANGGKISQGAEDLMSNNENLDGAASQTNNAAMTSDNDYNALDNRGLSQKILELQPMKTPFDQLTRHASTGEKPAGMKLEYASIGSRPTETKIATNHAFSIANSAMSATLYVDDPAIFSIDDVILVPTVKAVTDFEGNSYASKFGTEYGDGAWPCLQLKVCGYDDSTSMPVVYAMNGNKNSSNNQPICVNSLVVNIDGTWTASQQSIPAGTKLLRIAKAVNEGASQTGRTAELPKTDTQFLQIFMTQSEESLIHKLTKRDVSGLDLAWHERRTLEDMRMVQEGTFLFSDMTCISGHPKENLNKVWTTKGAWYQAGNSATFGHTDTSGNLVVSDDDLVDLNNELFVGEGTGGKKKLLFCGSDFITALEKITSEKFRLKGDVQAWNLTFTSWKTTFGEVLAIHDETLDKYGKSKCAFSLDPEYFEKRVLQSMDRNAIDLNSIGVRATQAVVLKEISAVVLYAPMAHARITLAA